MVRGWETHRESVMAYSGQNPRVPQGHFLIAMVVVTPACGVGRRCCWMASWGAWLQSVCPQNASTIRAWGVMEP